MIFFDIVKGVVLSIGFLESFRFNNFCLTWPSFVFAVIPICQNIFIVYLLEWVSVFAFALLGRNSIIF